MVKNVVDIAMTVSFLKEKISQKSKQVDVNLSNLGEPLFFAKLCLTNEYNSHNEVHALMNTGAANSLLHTKIPYELVSLRLWF